MPEPKFRCLIANDDALQLTILEAIFERHNCDVVTAQNGQQAFEEVACRTSDPMRMFDLVILDLNMPVTDGFEACRTIRNLFQGSFQVDQELRMINSPEQRENLFSVNLRDYLPHLVAVSSFIDDETERLIRDAGFYDRFLMPLGFEEIGEKILPVLRQRRERMEHLRRLANVGE